MVVYDTAVTVLVPATKVRDKRAIKDQIDRIEAGATTALYGGVLAGAGELRKFLAAEQVNRLFLLSDGLANVGPKSPAELGQLGSDLIKEGISVSTIGLGLGYNEDLMTELALKSDGSHSFAETPEDLARFFEEDFGEAFVVAAQDVTVTIQCAEGVRPVRVLGHEAEIAGQEVKTRIKQLYSSTDESVLLEVEVASSPPGSTRDIAKVHLDYRNMASNLEDRLERAVAARFTEEEREAAAGVRKDAMATAIERVAAENTRRAVELRDAGRVEEARKLFLANRDELMRAAELYGSPFLKEYAKYNEISANSLASEDWKRERKQIRYEQSAVERGRAPRSRSVPSAPRP
jgi:Ca-activated chloride channel family protein